MSRRALAIVTWVTAGLMGQSILPAFAQGRTVRAPVVASSDVDPSTELRARFGTDRAARLLRSDDPDERLRAIARAAAMQSPEGLALIVDATKPMGVSRTDTRVMLAAARGLAAYTDQPSAREALVRLVDAPLQPVSARSNGSGPATPDAPHDAEQGARGKLARQVAALALASSGDTRAAEALVALARAGGPGQSAAGLALETYPPAQAGVFGNASLSSAAILRVLARTGDLRALEAVHGIVRTSDPGQRAEALRTLGMLGDLRGAKPAEDALTDPDPRVRGAAAEALVALQVPSRFHAVEQLLRDDDTAAAGVRLADGSTNVEAVKLLAARASHPPIGWDAPVRAAAVAALGRAPHDEAVRALVELWKDPWLQGDAADALARSPSTTALSALETLAASPASRRLAARAYVVRALVRGASSGALNRALKELAASADGQARAVGVGGLIALGKSSVSDGLDDRDARVRRAAAVAALARPTRRVFRLLLERLRVERDEATRRVLAIGLLDGDPEGIVPTLILVDRAESGGPDAPLAALALARRGDDANLPKVASLFGAPDPIMRAHVARGLGGSSAKDAVGQLATAYAYETDVSVRRACIEGLAARTGVDADAPFRLQTLRSAARLDPDPLVRALAKRGLLKVPPAPAGGVQEVAWLRVADPEGRPPSGPTVAAVLRADGSAVPIAFDDDGYALVPGTPPGEARLILAPRLPAYDAARP